ncbi:TPA: sugar ABC transporter permease [Escherichia coli]
MSKSNPSEVKLAVPTSGGFSGLKSLNLQVFVMIAAIIAIMLFFTWTTDGAYLSARNVSNLLRQTAITGILAGMLAFRGILIGITNGTTVSPTSAAMSQIGQSYLPASTGFIIGALGLMAFVGWQWRGRMRRQALGLQSPASTAVVGRQALTAIIVLGAIWLLNDYRGVPTPVLLLTLLLLGGMFMATRTAFGRRIYAIGGNLEAARLSGINVERTKLAVFAINGLMVAIAGLILSSRLGAGSPSAGNIAELDAIAACVIGGTSLAGGVGSVAGAVMGAFIMASLDNGMSMMDVPTFWQYIVKGAILLLAVWMDSATKRRS